MLASAPLPCAASSRSTIPTSRPLRQRSVHRAATQATATVTEVHAPVVARHGCSEAEEVLGVRPREQGDASMLEYLVRQKNVAHSTWEPAASVPARLIREYDDRWWAAACKVLDAMAQVLHDEQGEGLPMAVNEDRLSPLHLAAGLGIGNCVKLFAQSGADVNSQDTRGHTPLHIAAGRMHTGCIMALLQAGADPTVKDCSGRDVVQLVDQLKPMMPSEAAAALSQRTTLERNLRLVERPSVAPASDTAAPVWPLRPELESSPEAAAAAAEEKTQGALAQASPQEVLVQSPLHAQRLEKGQVTYMRGEEDWEHAVAAAGSSLVVVEVHGESVCQLSTEAAPEFMWEHEAKAAREHALAMSKEIQQTFRAVARDAADATFLSLTVGDEPSPGASALVQRLGVEVLPTLQFWRNGAKLWERKGAQHMAADLAEGVLYYDGSMAEGARARDFVRELHTQAQFESFVYPSRDDSHVLRVINVALTSATPCVKVFPAVVALAKSFAGYASFARVLGDEGPEGEQLLKEHNIVEAPTFLFFRDGREVGRHVGSNPADLVGRILQIQSDAGVAPPPRQRGRAPVPQRARMVRRV